MRSRAHERDEPLPDVNTVLLPDVVGSVVIHQVEGNSICRWISDQQCEICSSGRDDHAIDIRIDGYRLVYGLVAADSDVVREHEL